MYEVARSSTASRLGIDNTPDEFVLSNAYQVAEHILQPVRDEFGSFSPSSWFRCEALEKVLTRKSFIRWCAKHGLSYADPDAWKAYFMRKSHPRGEAVDFEIIGVSNAKVFEWCTDNIPEFDQLIAEFMKPNNDSAGWIHASYSFGDNRQQILNIG